MNISNLFIFVSLFILSDKADWNVILCKSMTNIKQLNADPHKVILKTILMFRYVGKFKFDFI